MGLTPMSIAAVAVADGDWSASSIGRPEGTAILGDRTELGLEVTVMSALHIGHLKYILVKLLISCASLRRLHRDTEENLTHKLLSLNQPSIDLVNVEDMSAWQYS